MFLKAIRCRKTPMSSPANIFGEPLELPPMLDSRNDNNASPTGVDDAWLEISTRREMMHEAELNYPTSSSEDEVEPDERLVTTDSAGQSTATMQGQGATIMLMDDSSSDEDEVELALLREELEIVGSARESPAVMTKDLPETPRLNISTLQKPIEMIPIPQNVLAIGRGEGGDVVGDAAGGATRGEDEVRNLRPKRAVASAAYKEAKQVGEMIRQVEIIRDEMLILGYKNYV
eukprot:1643184-Prymnesium_polylepis.1